MPKTGVQAANWLNWPVPGHYQESQGYHDGGAIDINDVSIAGADVVAAKSGTVVDVFECDTTHYGSNGDCHGLGTAVAILGDDGRYYTYAHMQARSLSLYCVKGMRVQAGQRLGRVGKTGNATGYHLHFKISLGSIWNKSGIDPNEEYYLDGPSNLPGGSGSGGQNPGSNNGGTSGSQTQTYYMYKDVAADGSWRYEAIKYVTEHGIMNGTGNNMFTPNGNLTRAMFATMIYRMAGSEGVEYVGRFPDVTSGRYYSLPIVWAYENGIINGYSNTGYFGPNDYITRQDLVVIMYRYSNWRGFECYGDTDLLSYRDGKKISAYAQEAMRWAITNGILNGRSNTGLLDPRGNATRVEAAAIIQRFMTRYGF